MRRCSHPLALTLLAFAMPAFANDAALKRCRAVKDPPQRLACYDALADTPSPSLAPPAVAPRSVPPASAVAPPAAVPAEGGESRFGLERRTPAAELATIESSIPGAFQGWGPNYR